LGLSKDALPVLLVHMSDHHRPAVLHYTGADDDRGGIMSVVRALADADRFDCTVGVNPGFRFLRPAQLAALELPRTASESINLRTWWRAGVVARAVAGWLSEDQRRVFHGHTRAGLLVALRLAGAGERRVVASVHCYGRQKWFYRWAARRLAGRLFWLSPAMKRHYGVGDGSWSQCIPGCVSLNRVSSPGASAKEKEPLVFGGIGALVRWKGWHLVIEALARLSAEERRRIRFRHVGSPVDSDASRRYARELREHTGRLGLNDGVEWLGEQPSSDSLLTTIDCLVVASDHEPFSIAMLESLAAGVPVLAADSGGACDLLQPGETGWFFRTGDPADLARSMARLVQAKGIAPIADSLAAVRPFTAPVVAGQWAEVYAGLQ